MRLQAFLSRSGVASRRRCEEIVRSGHVRVNGKVVVDPAHQIDTETDHVKLEGRRVELRRHHRTVLLNKPAGVLVTHADPQGRTTIHDLVEDKLPRPIYAAGRLDYQSEGALILSTDGTLIQRISHPSHKLPRVYLAKVKGRVSEETLRRLREGVELSDGMTSPAWVKIRRQGQRNAWIKIVIQEGRNRQIRRMGEAVGHPVLRLRRISIGSVHLGKLARGQFRDLTPRELAGLRSGSTIT